MLVVVSTSQSLTMWERGSSLRWRRDKWLIDESSDHLTCVKKIQTVIWMETEIKVFNKWLTHTFLEYICFKADASFPSCLLTSILTLLLSLGRVMEKVETKRGAVNCYGSLFLLPSVASSCLSSIWIKLFTHSSPSRCLSTSNAHQWLPAYWVTVFE